MENKDGIMGKIARKGKALTRAVVLGSVILGTANADAKSITEQTKISAQIPEQKEFENVKKQEALNLFEDSMKAEAMEGLKNEYEIKHSKERVVQVKLNLFALKLKQGFPKAEIRGEVTTIRTEGTVYPEDKEKALLVLKGYLDTFIDKHFGNGNSAVTTEERNKFKSSFSSYPGLGYLVSEIERVVHK